MDRGRAAIGLDSPGHAATGRKCCKTLVRDDRRSQDFTLGDRSVRNDIAPRVSRFGVRAGQVVEVDRMHDGTSDDVACAFSKHEHTVQHIYMYMYMLFVVRCRCRCRCDVFVGILRNLNLTR